jgi:hypothetical protein
MDGKTTASRSGPTDNIFQPRNTAIRSGGDTEEGEIEAA